MQRSLSLQKALWGACFVSILILVFWLRIQDVERIPDGQFTGNDAYLYYKQAQNIAEHGYLPALSGFIVFLGCLSWEAFGLFVLIILATELWTFCSTDTEQHLKENLIYLLMFVPWLYIISPAYHSGYGFAKHLFALTLAPLIAVFALRGTRYLLLKHIARLQSHARKLAGGLTLLAITAGGIYLFTQADTFETTAFTLRESLLMKSIGELADTDVTYWTLFYQS